MESYSMPHQQEDNKQQVQRRRFTEDEDKKLIELVSHYKKQISWNLISLQMKTRTAKQCRDRYYSNLSPGISNDAWTKDEDELLARKVKEYGKKWKLINTFFPKRGSNNIKNRWYKKLSKIYDTTVDIKDVEMQKEDVIQTIQFSEDNEFYFECDENYENEVF